MEDFENQKLLGPWIIHHGQKVNQIANGSAEFPAIDTSAKSARFLARISTNDDTELKSEVVKKLAKEAGLNPVIELPAILDLLERKRLIEKFEKGIYVFGVTSHATVLHSADIYADLSPSWIEDASISLAEMASNAPILKTEALEQISDTYSVSNNEVSNFLNQAEQYKFIDTEGKNEDKLLFNPNLFRKNPSKSFKILGSLDSEESSRMNELNEILIRTGCVDRDKIISILGTDLQKKLTAAGVYDIIGLGNEQGEHAFATLPSVFNKFVDPMVDDSLNLAKKFVASLTFGMNSRHSGEGKIRYIRKLLEKLVRGGEVGATTSIGLDYIELEANRVVELREDSPRSQLFHMKLLKKEVGELALEVLTGGQVFQSNETGVFSQPLKFILEPEYCRTKIRALQSNANKASTMDLLNSLRKQSI